MMMVAPWSSEYDEMSQTLRIRFPNGKVYSLDGVPPDIAKGYVEADSKGSYFNQYLRGKY